MKNAILFIVISVLFSFCSEQAPTQLLDDTASPNEQLDIEVLPREQNVFDYSSDYDSTGIFEPIRQESSVIFANGIKNTYSNITVRQLYMSSVLIDKKMPVFHRGGRIIGYYSTAEGKVKFNNEYAQISDRKVRIMLNGVSKDTSLGKMFVIKKRYLLNIPQNFPYNSSIKFEYEKSAMGNHRTSFDIITPDEINGEIKVSGKKSDKDLKIELKWNAKNSGKIEIIIGGGRKDKLLIKPLLRLRTDDDGLLKLPWTFLRSLPFGQFDYLVLSFERAVKKSFSNQMIGENLVISKSIHNIKFDIP